MTEFIYFHETMIIEEKQCFLLLSVDKRNVYWSIKVEDGVNEQFIQLVSFILHDGVEIIGICHDGEDLNLAERFYSELIKNDLICKERFYVCVYKSLKIECQLFLKGITGSIPKIQIKFDNLTFKFKKEFLVVKTVITPLVLVNKNNYLMNETYSSIMGINIPDLAITIPNIKNEDEINEMYNHKLQTFYDSEETENELTCAFLIDSDIQDNTYFEETNNTFYSIYQNVPKEQIIKSIKINIVCVMNKSSFCNLSDICNRLINRYDTLMLKMDNLNKTKINTFSLFNYYNSDYIPIPLGILYSSTDHYNQQEEDTVSQRAYFHSILNLPDDKPKIKTIQLSNTFRQNLFFVHSPENVKQDQARRIFNIHTEKLKEKECVSVKGDYIYYNTGTGNLRERSWSGGYRCLQSFMSYFVINGYANIQIPSIKEIQNTLVYLGQVSSQAMSENHTLSLTNSAMIFNYFIDCESEISCLLGTGFAQNFDKIFDYIHNTNLPMILFSNTTYLIVGASKLDKSILIINHNYTGQNNLYNIRRSSVCKWVPFSEIVLEDDEQAEILSVKFNKII